MIFLESYWFFPVTLSYLIFDDRSYAYVFKLTAVLLPLFGLNAFLLSILNGFNRFNKVIQINLIYAYFKHP